MLHETNVHDKDSTEAFRNPSHRERLEHRQWYYDNFRFRFNRAALNVSRSITVSSVRLTKAILRRTVPMPQCKESDRSDLHKKEMSFLHRAST